MEEKPSVNEVVRCSFCKKTQNEVRKIIAGPAAFICDECVEVCVDVIFNDIGFEHIAPDSAEGGRWRSIATKITGEPGSCGLCGKAALQQNLLPIEGRGMLCGECADAIEDALAQGRPAS